MTGIDMPQQSVSDLRRQLEDHLAPLVGQSRIVIFGCKCGANANVLAAPDTAVINLLCTGALSPAFVEYALRGGADGVLLASCRSGGCEYRLGDRWTAERLSGLREPHLRNKVPLARVQQVHVSNNDNTVLAEALREFRNRIEIQRQSASDDPLPPYSRRKTHHA